MTKQTVAFRSFVHSPKSQSVNAV